MAKKTAPKRPATGVTPARAKARAKALTALVKKLEALDAAARSDGQVVAGLDKARAAMIGALPLIAAGKSG